MGRSSGQRTAEHEPQTKAWLTHEFKPACPTKALTPRDTLHPRSNLQVAQRRARRLPKAPASPIADGAPRPAGDVSAAISSSLAAAAAAHSAPGTPSRLHLSESVGGTPAGGGSSSSLSRSSAASRRSSQTPRASSKVLRSFLRGDAPKRPGRDVEAQYVTEALACVERNDLERLNALMADGLVDVNAVDGDGHTLLDLAVMLNQHGCIRLLQLFGAVETEACKRVKLVSPLPLSAITLC